MTWLARCTGYYSSLPDRNPNLLLLHDAPVFAATIDKFKLRIAGQLAEIRALVSAGELAATPEQVADLNTQVSY